MIFPKLIVESVVQTQDKTRLNGSRSFTTQDEAAVTLVEIEPESGSGFIDVTPNPATDSTKWFLDWAYSGATRTVTATIRITTDGSPVTSTADIQVNTPADDELLSSDDDISRLESELRIRPFFVPGRNSYLNYHREARDQFIQHLRDMNFTKNDGSRIEASDFITNLEVRQIVQFWTLKLIFQDNSNSVDDKFADKAAKYESLVLKSLNRANLPVDLDDDGTIDLGEGLTFGNVRVKRV